MIRETERLKEKIRKVPKAIDWSKGLSTGSTTLNLALSGKIGVGYLPGLFYLWIGSSGSGKTFLTMTALAEASINPAYDGHELVFVNAENGMLMDVPRYFGSKLAERLRPLAGTRARPACPTVLEDYYDLLYDRLDAGPCVVLTDSMDALVPRAWQKKVKADRRAASRGEDAGGSYGTEKARVNSDRMRMIPDLLRKHKSIYILISQSRDNIGWNAQFAPETRGGGRALTFYAALEMWTKVVGHLKKKVGPKEREQGVLCQVRVRKNRLTGRDRSAVIPILHSFGIDDIGSCVDFLVEEGRWKQGRDDGGEAAGKKTAISAPDFDFAGSREKLIRHVEEAGLERELRLLVAETFDEIEEACSMKRKSKYV